MLKKLLFLGLFFINYNIFSQQAANSTNELSLKDCINIALEKNPDYQLAKQKMNIANAALKYAGGQYYPNADFTASYNRQLLNNGAKTMSFMGQVFQMPGTDPNSFSTSIGINYNVFDGFNRSNNYKKAELNFASSEFNIKAYKNYVINNINKLYVEVIKKQQEIKIQNENYNTGKAQLDDIKAKFNAGFTHIGAVSAQEAELANREFAIVQAETDLNSSKLNLLNFMGMPLNTSITLSESSIPLSNNSADMKQILDKYTNTLSRYDSAINKRYDIQAYNNAIEAGKLSVEAAYSGYYPKLMANAGWSWSNSKLEKFSELSRAFVGATISVPIFEQFQTNYQIENAKFEIMQNEAELFKLKQNIQNSINASIQGLQLAYKQLEISERALSAAEKNFDIAKERFNLGSAGITDYITANNSLILSKINRNSAFYNFYLAQKEIEFQTSNIAN